MEEYQSKKEKISSYLIYNIDSLGNMFEKLNLFYEDNLNMNL